MSAMTQIQEVVRRVSHVYLMISHIYPPRTSPKVQGDSLYDPVSESPDSADVFSLKMPENMASLKDDYHTNEQRLGFSENASKSTGF